MKSIKLLLTSAIILCFTVSMAQKIDEERMKRDIAVAENILSTLIKEGRGTVIFLDNVEGRYVEDYGIMLTVPRSHFQQTFTYSTTVSGGDKEVVVLNADGDGVVTVNGPKISVETIDRDSLYNVQQEKIIESVKTFLADYGHLINQLQPDQKILVTDRNRQFSWMRNNSGVTGLSVEASVKDIRDYNEGKISRNVIMERINVAKPAVSEEKSTDLELLSSIIGRLYRSDLSNTYYTNGSVPYDRLPNFGVIFQMKVYSSTEVDGKHKIITRDITGLSKEERDKMVKEMYPEFLNSIKENLLEYGKTVKSLENDEILMMQVNMTKCVGCLPGEIEVSVKNDVLQKYGQGKISRSQALNEVKVKEGTIQ